MIFLDFLQFCQAKSIRFSLESDQLKVNAPPNTLSPEVVQRLREFKPALIEWLQESAAKNRQGALEEAGIARVDRDAALQPSFGQEQLWLTHKLDDVGESYHFVRVLELDGELDPGALDASFTAIVERHESLRTVFVEHEGAPVQKILAPAQVRIATADISAVAPAQQEAEAAALRKKLSAAPFDLAQDSMLRLQLIKLAPQRHHLVIVLHHIASDGWSLGILVKELQAFYLHHVRRDDVEPAAAELPAPLPVQYADYSQWLRDSMRGERYAASIDYWKQKLQGVADVHGLPTDRPRPQQQSFRGGHVRMRIDAGVARQIKQLAQEAGATLFMALETLFAALVSCYSRSDDVVIGTAVANRAHQDVEGLIGYFVNVLALRHSIDQNLSFAQLLPLAKKDIVEAYSHERVPFDKVVNATVKTRSTSYGPLVQIAFILQNNEVPELALAGVTCRVHQPETSNAMFDLQLEITETPSGLDMHWEYAADLFEQSTIERMAGHFQRLVAGAAEHPQLPLNRIELLGAQERGWLQDWNATDADYPRQACIQHLFERQAAASPDAVALVYDETELSYAELNRRANQLAHYLVQEKQVKPDALVGLCLERSSEMVIGLLAILKAGGAYVPLDPEYPHARLAYMLEDSGLTTVLTQTHLLDKTPTTERQALCLDDPRVQEALAERPDGNLDAAALGLGPHHLAYVIYTSGSTGNPKGVMVEQRQVVNFLQSMRRTPGLDAGDCLLAVTSTSFDIHGLELFLPLTVGARLVVAAKAATVDPDKLGALMARHNVSLLQATPATWKMLVDAGWRYDLPLKALCGGEALSLPLANALLAQPALTLWNMYGPTETTIWSCCKQILPGSDVVLMGQPIDNTQVYIVHSDSGRQMPVGVPGELLIGGAGVTRGYFERPELTQEKFIPNPFRDRADAANGGRLYRTGDLARWRADGNLEFLGRIDHQVKIRGFRIELGEIENALLLHAQVKDAVVAARQSGAGDKRLVAYVVAHADAGGDAASATSQAALAEALRAHLGGTLPDYMVPSAFMFLDAMPLTPNGKVDRKALPEPQAAQQLGYVAPRTEIEAALCNIWQEVLGVARVGATDNFFQLGGHSLLATQMASKIRQTLKVDLPLRAVFEALTVEALAARIAAGQAAGADGSEASLPPIEPADRTRDLPLSFAQQRLWFFDQLEPNSAFYNIPAAIRLRGPLDRHALKDSFNDVVRRHEILRTTFAAVEDTPMQVIAPALELALPLTDLSNLPPEQREAEALRLARDDAQLPFDLAAGPLLRTRLVRLSDTDHMLILTQHHIVFDGWSAAILMKEMAALYRQHLGQQTEGTDADLPALPIQYADFAAWQHQWQAGGGMQKQLGYWTRQMAGSPALTDLPTDFPRPAAQSYRGDSTSILLPSSLTVPLEALARQHNATLFMAMLTVLDIMLFRWSGQRDLVVGTVIAGRTSSAVEPLIGCFMNFLPLRAQCSPHDSALSLMKRLSLNVLDAYAHQDVPFERITKALNPPRNASHNPVFNVGFLLQNVPPVSAFNAGLSAEIFQPVEETATLDLRFVAEEKPDGIRLACNYSTDLFSPDTVTALLEAYRDLAAYCLQQPDASISKAPLPASLERKTASAQPGQGKRQGPQLAIAAGFTAEPIEDALAFWMKKLDLGADICFAPYNQIFQTLLDPHGLFAQNKDGANVVLLRLEDWLRFADAAAPEAEHIALLRSSADQLVSAAAAAAADARVALLVCICPPSARAPHRDRIEALQMELADRLRAIAGVYPVVPEELQRLYPVEAQDDEQADELGHIPYTADMYAALGTLLARKLATLRSRPYKAVVLDCDNTLWQGVCGEVGPHGIEIAPAHLALQRFMVAQQEAGMLVCLASKNNPEDVAAVFEQRADMLLGQGHIVASRVNWLPKSDNIKALAAELGLGLDSFIFIDDNPVECAEVRGNCPEVLTLQLPEQGERIPAFLQNLWAFDRLAVTADAQQRTQQYRQNLERETVRASASSFADFLSSLELRIEIAPLAPEQLERAAELTQRTNQFNLRPMPRNAAQMRTLGQECLAVSVQDRFGSYGLVGLMAYRQQHGQDEAQGTWLDVDTFLLSCRVLGRGVEHAMLRQLGAVACQAECGTIALPCHATGKNRPLLDFLEAACGQRMDAAAEASYRFTIAAEHALQLQPQAASQANEERREAEDASVSLSAATRPSASNALASLIATELDNVPAIVRALAAATVRSALSSNEYVAPRNETESALRKIWQDVLGIKRVGATDNFFQLGGHSLSATRLMAQVNRSFGVSLPIRTLFSAQTLEGLAQVLRQGDAGADIAELPSPALAPVSRHEVLLPSFAQRRLWMLDQIDGGSAHYNMPSCLRLSGRLDRDAFDRAFGSILERHESLRTIFSVGEDGQPHQLIQPATPMAIPFKDISALPEGERQLQLALAATDEAGRVFDLGRDMMLRAQLFKLAPDEHMVFITMHHIASDGWSLAILINEFSALYGAYAEGGPNPLAPLPIQYADYAHWQRNWLSGEVLGRQLAYWKQQLAGLPVVHGVPLDHARPHVQTFAGEVYSVEVDAAAVQALGALCLASNATLFMGLHAAFSTLLARYSNEYDIVVGSPIANREQAEVAGLIGFFVNTLVLRSDLSGDPSFLELLEQGKRTLLDAYAHQQVPFEQIVERLQPERSLGHSPLFQIMLVLQNNEQGTLALPGLTLNPVHQGNAIAKYDLTLYMTPGADGHGLRLDWEYNTDLFDASTIARMSTHFERLLRSLAASPRESVFKADMLAPAERLQQLQDRNATVSAYRKGFCLHQLFEQQVARTPDATALVSGGERLSYDQLNVRANRLAHYLVAEKAVGPDKLVGVCLDRSFEAVTAILAVLKAGGAYVPLDPAYPQARLAYMLEDAALETVITDRASAQRLPLRESQALCIDDAQLQLGLAVRSAADIDPSERGVKPDSLAYVIYTSGSTGKPKGVLGEHLAMVNRLCWMERFIEPRADDVFCHKTSIAFVDHVAEIFQPLICGCSLVLVAHDDVADAHRLAETIVRHRISRITLVPSLLQALLEDETASRIRSLRYVVSSGEPLTLRVAKQFQSALPGASLVNLYGSTEIGADATVYEIGSLYDNPEVMRYFVDDGKEAQASGSAISYDENKYKKKNLPLQEVADHFQDTAIPERPMALGDYVDTVNEHVIPNLIDVSSELFVGHMTSKLPSFVPAISELITRLNQNVVKIETSKGMTFIERQVISSMHRLFYERDESFYADFCQDPLHVFGVVVSGGSVANVTGLWYARNKAILGKGLQKSTLIKHGYDRSISEIGYRKGVILGTRLLHYSIKKAISVFGIGQDSFIEVAQDENQKMSVADLERRIEECREKNYLILAVIGIAGATETGTVDPLGRIAEVTRKHGIHFHVDAAWGGPFQFSDRHKDKLAGIEHADSITICPHKQLFLPQGISLCLFKDTRGIGAISTHAEYQAKEGSYDLGQYTLEGSRPANALFLHAGLYLISRQGYAWLIDQSMEKVRYLVKTIERSNCFELVGASPDLNIVNYRYIPFALRGRKGRYSKAENEMLSQAVELIQQRQFSEGRTFVSKTKILVAACPDTPLSVFRVVLSNPLTTQENLHEVLNDQLRIAQEHIEHAHGGPVNDPLASGKQGAVDYGNWLVPIGKPIDNARVYVLDPMRNPVPQGVVGELYVGGDCVARRYLNQPAQTEEKFLADPFCDIPGARMYRTGDLARWAADGNLEYVGRIDNQVKIRGFRIELGEIEATLAASSGVRDAVVLARDNAAGNKQLAAYVVAQEGAAIDIESLRQSLTQSLPAYMVPANIFVLAALPLTPNGKVDKKALPAPDAIQADAVHVAPANEIESKLCAIWARLLGLEQVGVHDNFFSIGGDSILSAKVVYQAGRAGIALNARQLFEHQTVRELARHAVLEDGREAAVAAPAAAAQPASKAAFVAMSEEDADDAFAYHPLPANRHWYFKRSIDLAAWGTSIAIRFADHGDHLAAVRKTVRHLQRTHDSLRLQLLCKEGQWLERVAGMNLLDSFHVEDLSLLSGSAQEEAFDARFASYGSSIELSKSLFKAVYFRMGDGQGDRLALVMHHIAMDQYSWDILMADFLESFRAVREGRVPVARKTRVSLAQWAASEQRWANGAQAQADAVFWLRQDVSGFAGLPADFDHTPASNSIGSGIDVAASLSLADTERFLAFVKQAQLPMLPVLVTAMAEAFHRWTGRRALALELVGSGRESLGEGLDLSETVGWLNEFIPIFVDLDGVAGGADSLRAVSRTVERHIAHGKGFNALKYQSDDAATRDALARIPAPELAVNFIPPSLGGAAPQMDGPFQLIRSEAMIGAARERIHLLGCEIAFVDGVLRFSWYFSSNVFLRESIESVAHDCVSALLALLDSVDADAMRPPIRAARRPAAAHPGSDLDGETGLAALQKDF